MCSQYFLELKMLMEMEDRIDYLFELELQKRITYYPSNQIPVIKMNNNQLTDDSKVKLYVVPTNEELMIARDTYEIVKNI